MKTSSKSVTEINEPIAICEFELENGSKKFNQKATKVVRCEMSRQGVTEMLHVLETIQKQIDGVSG
jgi:hypothetical protein